MYSLLVRLVNRGNYSVSALSTLSRFLFMAGGISETGSYRRIALRRGSEVTEFDIYDLLLYIDASRDARLQNGDVIFVPVVGPQVSLFGEVIRPAIYETKQQDTTGDVIEMGGGIKAKGYTRQVLLNRYRPGEPIPSISTLSLQKEETLKMSVFDRDFLRIRAVTE